MKTKLSEIEKLRLEKADIIEECRQYEEQFRDRWRYSKDNFGHLTVNSLFSSAKLGFNDLLGSLFGGKDTRAEEDGKSSSGFTQTLMAVSPIIWSIAQPLIIKFALRKIKSIFKRK